MLLVKTMAHELGSAGASVLGQKQSSRIPLSPSRSPQSTEHASAGETDP